MKSTIEELGPTRVRMAIEVAWGDLDHAFGEVYKELGKQVRVPGFRPGKVPNRILVRAGGRVRVLGRPSDWSGRTFDVTDLAGAGRVPLRLTADVQNRGEAEALILDRIALVHSAPDARPAAAPWLVALWLTSILVAALALMIEWIGRLVETLATPRGLA